MRQILGDRQYRLYVSSTGRLRTILLKLQGFFGLSCPPFCDACLQIFDFNLYPLLFYSSLLSSILTIIWIDFLDPIAPSTSARLHIPTRTHASSTTSLDSSAGEVKQRAQHAASKDGDIPLWVLEPAAAPAFAGWERTDPMQELKDCLLNGGALHECTDKFRPKGAEGARKPPASGVAGLKAMLMENVDNIPPGSHPIRADGHADASVLADSHAQPGPKDQVRPNDPVREGKGRAGFKGAATTAGGGGGGAAQGGKSNETAVRMASLEESVFNLALLLQAAHEQSVSPCSLVSAPRTVVHAHTPHKDSRTSALTFGFSAGEFDHRLLSTLLGDRRGGFFVDVGSLDGSLPSMTLMLETCMGWSGVCMEPVVSQSMESRFKSLRPRCSLVRAALSNIKTEALMWALDFPISSLSVLEDDASSEQIDAIGDALDAFPSAAKHDLLVPTSTLPAALESAGHSKVAVDLLVITVGSGAFAALQAANVPTLRPSVVVVDTTFCDAGGRQGVRKLMEREGYKCESERGTLLVFKRI